MSSFLTTHHQYKRHHENWNLNINNNKEEGEICAILLTQTLS